MKKIFKYFIFSLILILAGLLSAIASFIFQVLFNETLTLSPFVQLILFVFLEEFLKFFFWRNIWFLTFSSFKKNFLKIFLSSFLFAIGFWLLEIIFLKLKTSSWPISFSALILFLVHWITTYFLTNANQKFQQKKYLFFSFFIILSFLIHFGYNWIVKRNF